MLTALDDQKTKKKADELGAYQYIVKANSSIADVLTAVTEACFNE
jgi:hypothetical protein